MRDGNSLLSGGTRRPRTGRGVAALELSMEFRGGFHVADGGEDDPDEGDEKRRDEEEGRRGPLGWRLVDFQLC